MNISDSPITRSLLQILALFRRGGWMAEHAIEEPPLRSELFSADQMEQHGKALAAAHVLGAKRARDLLLARLADNEDVLLRACELLTAAIRNKRPGTPADWNGFQLHYRYRQTAYHITVRQSAGAEAGMAVSMDGVAQPGPAIALVEDRLDHRVVVDLQYQKRKLPAPSSPISPMTIK